MSVWFEDDGLNESQPAGSIPDFAPESDLRTMCSHLGVPPSFDVAQINWRPDYDPFYYETLCKRARNMFLFREEYIFECEELLVVERPQIGHATYLFAKPAELRTFAGLTRNAQSVPYARTGAESPRR